MNFSFTLIFLLLFLIFLFPPPPPPPSTLNAIVLNPARPPPFINKKKLYICSFYQGPEGRRREVWGLNHRRMNPQSINTDYIRKKKEEKREGF
ncbi:hypothetical protein V6Z11_D10G053300 [Gossypium hirsutum]